MHPNNRYTTPHDFTDLAKHVPALADFFVTTPDGRTSLDFTSPEAVRSLNKALLLRDYGLKHWDIPQGSLCPGVPGRLKEYGWRMVGTDVDATSLKVATAIARFNPELKDGVIVRKQPDQGAIFRNVILPGEYFDFTMCNPPFFDSAAAVAAAAQLKWQKLGVETDNSPTLNFGGRANELWTEGGEPAFLRRMIRESREFSAQVGWFTTLVSKKGYLKIAGTEFGRYGITETKVIGIGRGGKLRRVVCWRF